MMRQNPTALRVVTRRVAAGMQRPPGQGRRNPNRRNRRGRQSNGNGLGPLTVAPLATTRVTTNRGPRFGRNGFVPITNSEYIMEINGSTGFNVNAVQVNPGLVNSFPWLSKIANQFEKYRWKSLSFEYKTAVSAGGSTGQIGKVVLVEDYDARDPNFQGMQQALDYKGAKDAAPWKDIIFKADTSAKDTPYKNYYVRSGAVPSGTDIKTYDAGLFQLCTSGQNDANNIGYLRVHYSIELLEPKINAVLGGDLLCAHYKSGGTVDATHPMGTAPVQEPGSNMDLTFALDAVTGPVNPPGAFLVVWVATGTSINDALITPVSGCSLVTSFFVAGQATTPGVNTQTVSAAVMDFTAPNPVFDLTSTGSTDLYATGELLIAQISAGMSREKSVTGMSPLERKVAALTRQLGDFMKAPRPFVPIAYDLSVGETDKIEQLPCSAVPISRPLSAGEARLKVTRKG